MADSSLTNLRAVFIGGGNMAEAMIKGMVRGGWAADRIRVAEPDPIRRSHLASTYGVDGSDDNRAEAADADMLILAVKPQVMPEVVPPLGEALAEGTLVMSIAAGIPMRRITAWLGREVPLIRVMPNTPALVGKGASAMAVGEGVSEAQTSAAQSILEGLGVVETVEEADLDAVTALSGSGPAYVFYLLEAMLEAADRLGLEPDVARRLALATVEGAACLAAETGLDPAELRAKVTSRGGTTEAAIRVLDDHRVHAAIRDAVVRAATRSRELAGG